MTTPPELPSLLEGVERREGMAPLRVDLTGLAINVVLAAVIGAGLLLAQPHLTRLGLFMAWVLSVLYVVGTSLQKHYYAQPRHSVLWAEAIVLALAVLLLASFGHYITATVLCLSAVVLLNHDHAMRNAARRHKEAVERYEAAVAGEAGDE